MGVSGGEVKDMKSDSPEVWRLEQRAFWAANDETLPLAVRELVKELWREYCAAQKTAAQVNDG